MEAFATAGLWRAGESVSREPDRSRQASYSLIVHSRLPWDGPQCAPRRLFGGMARHLRVLYVHGEPAVDPPDASSIQIRPANEHPNILIITLRIPPETDPDSAASEQRRMLKTILLGPVGLAFERPVQWFDDPTAFRVFGGCLNEQAVVYHCTEPLAFESGEAPALVENENELLAATDVVFADGPSLQRAKREVNPNCHTYGCGVDAAAFRPDAARQRSGGPIFGCFGPFERRFDQDLVRRVAEQNPNATIVIVGTSGERPEALQRSNIRWVVLDRDEDVPAVAKTFDVCLLPYVTDASTEFWNPPAAIQALACGRPVVATAVPDVVSQFGGLIAVGRTPEEFLQRAREAVERLDSKAILEGLAVARRHDWAVLAERIDRHILGVLDRRTLRPGLTRAA